MAVKTKPVRVFESDASALRLISDLEGRTQARVVHEALAEYMQHHRDELQDVFRTAQEAFSSGDVNALALALSSRNQVDELMTHVQQVR